MATNGAQYANGINGSSWIDGMANPVHHLTDAAFHMVEPVRSALGGDWLGHRLHPMLNDIPIGAWTASLALDLVEVASDSKKLRKGADIVQAVGLAGAMAAALAGIVDWTRTQGEAKRYGFLHGAANMVVAGLYGGSLMARAAGMRKLGIALSTTGYCMMLGSGMLGSMVAYKLGALAQGTASATAGQSSTRPVARSNGAVVHF
jgi:uncharacterized membrane protein